MTYHNEINVEKALVMRLCRAPQAVTGKTGAGSTLGGHGSHVRIAVDITANVFFVTISHMISTFLSLCASVQFD